jgi:hypothetical protein
MAEVLEVRKGETDPRAKLAARVAKDFARAVKGKVALELTQAPTDLGPEDWEIFAFGPYQTPEAQPGRIIKEGETAYIAVVVWMNEAMCRVLTTHSDKIELSIFTSDTQRMESVDDLNHYCCIQTEPDHCWYVYVWEFTPPREACLYETNICARVCNCSDVPLPDYGGFVRHVYDFDAERLWPPIPATVLPDDFPLDEWPPGVPAPPSWGFDRPIRYMVYDPESSCECGDPDAADNNFCDHVISGPA